MERITDHPIPLRNARCWIEPLTEEDIMKLNKNEDRKEPDYYADNGLSPIGAFKQGLLSQEEYIGFCKGNIIKYVIRAGKKGNAVKDLKKAKDYINFYMDIFAMTSEEQAELNKELINTDHNIDARNPSEDESVRLCDALEEDDDEGVLLNVPIIEKKEAE